MKFCPTLNTIDKLILKEDFKKFGKKVQSGTVAMIIEYLTLILLNLSLILIQPKLCCDRVILKLTGRETFEFVSY